jgi:hypothetical protein
MRGQVDGGLLLFFSRRTLPRPCVILRTDTEIAASPMFQVTSPAQGKIFRARCPRYGCKIYSPSVGARDYQSRQAKGPGSPWLHPFLLLLASFSPNSQSFRPPPTVRGGKKKRESKALSRGCRVSSRVAASIKPIRCLLRSDSRSCELQTNKKKPTTKCPFE